MVTTVAWSDDGGRILSESDDGTAWIWDTKTWERLDPARGSSRSDARSAGARPALFRALTRGLETVIENPLGGPPIAWFPAAPGTITGAPSSPIWALSKSTHVFIIKLEVAKVPDAMAGAGGREDSSPVRPACAHERDR